MKLGRRHWLGIGGAAALSVPIGAWMVRGDDGDVPRGPRGGLRSDPQGVLDLLEGFSYRVLDRSGGRMTDGMPVPPRPDGMACLQREGGALVLMRNHEIPAGFRHLAIGRRWPDGAYQPDGGGAVTRLVLDPDTLDVRRANLVLAGTSTNCSGGASPWGWLTCEEDADDPVHGYVFLCDPDAGAMQRPRRIDAYGRFKHEAAAIEPDSRRCYLTEDQGDGCLYRFVPHDPSSPFEGRLQAMKVRGRRAEDLSPLRTGARREIEWVDLPDPTPQDDDLRHRARRAGAASLRRGEGIAYADGSFYLTATSGGPIGAGQIFRLEDDADGGTLEVVAASTDRGVMDMPDNITVAPDGTVFFAEDGGGHDLIRYVDANGRVLPLGRNAASAGEITGICFSPRGDACFVNLQEEGLTLAIRGPFDQLRGA